MSAAAATKESREKETTFQKCDQDNHRQNGIKSRITNDPNILEVFTDDGELENMKDYQFTSNKAGTKTVSSQPGMNIDDNGIALLDDKEMLVDIRNEVNESYTDKSGGHTSASVRNISKSTDISHSKLEVPKYFNYINLSQERRKNTTIISSSRNSIDTEEIDIDNDSHSKTNPKLDEEDGIISKPLVATTAMISEHLNSTVEVDDVENILNPTKENNNLSEECRKNPTVLSSSRNSILDLHIPTTNMLTHHKQILPSKSNNIQQTVQKTNKSNMNQHLKRKPIPKDTFQYNLTQKKIFFCKDTAQYDHIRRKTNDDSNLPILPLICKNTQTCNALHNNRATQLKKIIIQHKDKVHNNIAVSENQSTTQVPHQLHLQNVISRIPKLQHDGNTKRLSSTSNCSVDSPILNNNVFPFNNLSRQYSKTPRTPPTKDLK